MPGGLKSEINSAAGSQILDQLYTAKQSGQPYDLLLIRLDLPGMDGMTLIRMIRSTPELAALRIILLAPMAHPRLKELDQDIQLDHVVTKPVRITALHQVIAQTLGMVSASQFAILDPGRRITFFRASPISGRQSHQPGGRDPDVAWIRL